MMKLIGMIEREKDGARYIPDMDEQELTVTVELTGGHDPEATVTVTQTGKDIRMLRRKED